MFRIATLYCLSILVCASPLSAQSGTITYTRAAQFAFEIPDRLKGNPAMGDMPTADLETMRVTFTPGSTRMETLASPLADKPMDGDRKFVMTTRLKMGSTARADHERLVDAHTTLATGDYVEVYEFMGREFRIVSVRPTYRWKLTGEESRYLDHTVQRATTEHDGASIEVWFAPEIPVSGGPAAYGGLPGMILTVSVDDGRIAYTATGVDLTAPTEVPIAPTNGDQVTREEYEKIVAEKLTELEQSRSRRPAATKF